MVGRGAYCVADQAVRLVLISVTSAGVVNPAAPMMRAPCCSRAARTRVFTEPGIDSRWLTCWSDSEPARSDEGCSRPGRARIRPSAASHASRTSSIAGGSSTPSAVAARANFRHGRNRGVIFRGVPVPVAGALRGQAFDQGRRGRIFTPTGQGRRFANPVPGFGDLHQMGRDRLAVRGRLPRAAPDQDVRDCPRSGESPAAGQGRGRSRGCSGPGRLWCPAVFSSAIGPSRHGAHSGRSAARSSGRPSAGRATGRYRAVSLGSRSIASAKRGSSLGGHRSGRASVP
jgi:hypothetical protein